jgi:hypothetical protein
VVIDKYEMAVELLDKRSTIYSSRQVTICSLGLGSNLAHVYRPEFPMPSLMGGWDKFHLAAARYGESIFSCR